MDKFNSAAKKIQTAFNDWLGGDNPAQLDKMMQTMSSMSETMSRMADHADRIMNSGAAKYIFGGTAEASTALGTNRNISGMTGMTGVTDVNDGPIGLGPKVLITPQGVTRYADDDIGYMMKRGGGTNSSGNPAAPAGPTVPAGPSETAKTNELLTNLITQNNRIHGPGGLAYNQGMRVKG